MANSAQPFAAWPENGVERGMAFQFDELRATQAAATLLKLAGGRSNYTVLLKELYLADRQSLASVGTPISGASFANLTNGPLASDLYDCVKGSRPCPVWDEYIRKDGRYEVVLVKDPGDSELSDFDIETLTSLSKVHCGKTYGDMIDFVHGLPEWRDPAGSSQPLPPEEILRGANVDAESIKDFAARNDHVASVANLLR